MSIAIGAACALEIIHSNEWHSCTYAEFRTNLEMMQLFRFQNTANCEADCAKARTAPDNRKSRNLAQVTSNGMQNTKEAEDRIRYERRANVT